MLDDRSPIAPAPKTSRRHLPEGYDTQKWPDDLSQPHRNMRLGHGRMHWTGRVLFLCLGGVFLWLGFLRQTPETVNPMERIVSHVIFGLFTFWAFWSALFATRASAAFGPEREIHQPPASRFESLIASIWMVARRLLLYPVAVFFILGGGYLLAKWNSDWSNFIASVICFYAGYRAFTAGKYGQGDMQSLSDARQIDKERRRRYHWDNE